MLKSFERHSAHLARFGTLGLVLLVLACQTDQTITGSIPHDYRDRHPIRLTEGQRSVQLLIGAGRGGLTAEQRAQVGFMAGTWRREGTGVIVLDVPTGTPNARAARYAAREAQSLLRASGVPARGIVTRHYHPPQAHVLGPLRLSYARIEAHTNPCGEWPEDIGASPIPSIGALSPQLDNRPYWNFGCATQQNLAAAVANPEDLIQPRAETPPYAARRQSVIDKYRKGEDPSTVYRETQAGKASQVGQ